MAKEVFGLFLFMCRPAADFAEEGAGQQGRLAGPDGRRHRAGGAAGQAEERARQQCARSVVGVASTSARGSVAGVAAGAQWRGPAGPGEQQVCSVESCGY
jgi:hypothetical protein